jgi:hypothetical protein
MAALTTNHVPLTALRYDNLLTAANAGGDDCEAGAGIYLIVHNSNAATRDVTLVTPGTVDGLAIADRVFTLTATTGMHIVPVGPLYRDATTGRCSITYTAATGVTVCVIRVATS